jgi:hypothetical protein
MRKLTIRMDDAMHRIARSAAAARGVSVSALVRSLLDTVRPVDGRTDAVHRSLKAMDAVKGFSAGNRLPREQLHRTGPYLAGIAALGFSVAATAAEPWWRTVTPGASVGVGVKDIETVQPGAARGVGTLGWYGFWFLDQQDDAGFLKRGRAKLDAAGVKQIVYYDVGEVGDFAGFFDPDGRMVRNGWSLPWWKGEPALTARWVGLDAFLRDVRWAPFPGAKTYGLPAFTTPDGKPADDLYATLARRGLDGAWSFDLESNAGITDDIAQRSGLAGLVERQSGAAEVQGKTGWPIVRLVDLDFANPQMAAYCAREIGRIIPALRPAGIHADNLGDNNLGYANRGAFGLWSVATFRDHLRRRFSSADLQAMGVTNPATFDITAYIREKPFESRGHAWHPQNRRWADDPVWAAYRVHKVETALAYHRSFYDAAKAAARKADLDCAVFGNTIPMPLGGALMKGVCDIAHFEWSTVHGWWGLRPTGLPPTGRVDYVTRLGAAVSDAGYCWPSIYVSKDLSGAGHENLHKMLAFDCLANRGLLDFGHWYRDGYSPGTPESAGFVNRFIRDHAEMLSARRLVAEVAVVHSAWSEIASCTVFNPLPDLFIDEYTGWCRFLGDTHRQWDVVLQQDLSATNLARFPVVVLPSVLSLTDAEIAGLRRYVDGGGRLVATGLTGTRHGPERNLAARTTAFAIPGATIVTNRPGGDYWRRNSDTAAAKAMTDLLAAAGGSPRLQTDAPATVGVNLNRGNDAAGPFLALDLNNVDLDVAADAIRPAPAVATTIRLPDDWPAGPVRVACLRPGAPDEPLPAEAVTPDAPARTLRLRTPAFDTMLILCIRPGKVP